MADRVPAASKEWVYAMLDSILEAPSPADAREALERATAKLQEMAPGRLEVLEEGFEDATAALALPEKSRRRLIGALCAEQHEEWAHGRRYLTMEAYVRWKAKVEQTDGQQPPNPLPKAA